MDFSQPTLPALPAENVCRADRLGERLAVSAVPDADLSLLAQDPARRRHPGARDTEAAAAGAGDVPALRKRVQPHQRADQTH